MLINTAADMVDVVSVITLCRGSELDGKLYVGLGGCMTGLSLLPGV